MKKTVCVVTGTRAEWGLLRGVVKKMEQSEILRPSVVVTGAHLSDAFGHTVAEVEAEDSAPTPMCRDRARILQ